MLNDRHLDRKTHYSYTNCIGTQLATHTSHPCSNLSHARETHHVHHSTRYKTCCSHRSTHNYAINGDKKQSPALVPSIVPEPHCTVSSLCARMAPARGSHKTMTCARKEEHLQQRLRCATLFVVLHIQSLGY